MIIIYLRYLLVVLEMLPDICGGTRTLRKTQHHDPVQVPSIYQQTQYLIGRLCIQSPQGVEL